MYLQVKDQEAAHPSGALVASRAGLPAALPMVLHYWRIAMRWNRIIFSVLALSLVGGVVATLLMTPQYTAASRVEISRDQKRVTNVQGVDSGDASQDLEFYQTQYALLGARTLAERVSRELKLARSDEFFTAHRTTPADVSMFGAGPGRVLSPNQLAERERLVVKLLQKNISINPVRGSSLIDVQYTSGSAALSSRIANAWVAQFVAMNIDRRFVSTADARRFLEGRLVELRSRLEQSERDAVNYAAQRGIVALSISQGPNGKSRTDSTLASEDLVALNEALAKATADRIAAVSTLRQGSEAGVGGLALGNETISTLRAKRADVAAERDRLAAQFEPEYPAVKSLTAQIAGFDSSIAREERRVQSSIRSDYQQALAKEQQLQATVNGLKSQFNRQNRDSIQYNIYRRDADTNRELYDGLLQRYKEIGVAGVSANNVSIVDMAEPPVKPSSPRLIVNMLVALLVGLTLSAVATFVLDQIDEGLKDPGEVPHLLKIPLLGGIPEDDTGDVMLALGDPKSVISEAYFTMRSNLALSTTRGIPRSIMVTSSRAAEGKSTTSLATAIVLSRTGKSVALVDADMRSPSVHGFFELPNDRGLSNYLAGDGDWRSMMRSVADDRLSIMSSGPTPPSAAELLSTDRMALLVTELLLEFDHVVVDAPPLLGLADAALLSKAVEGSIFVIEANGVPIRGIRTALDRLVTVSAMICGAVVTRLDSKNMGYGYGYGYGHTYGLDASERL